MEQPIPVTEPVRIKAGDAEYIIIPIEENTLRIIRTDNAGRITISPRSNNSIGLIS